MFGGGQLVDYAARTGHGGIHGVFIVAVGVDCERAVIAVYRNCCGACARAVALCGVEGGRTKTGVRQGAAAVSHMPLGHAKEGICMVICIGRGSIAQCVGQCGWGSTISAVCTIPDFKLLIGNAVGVCGTGVSNQRGSIAHGQRGLVVGTGNGDADHVRAGQVAGVGGRGLEAERQGFALSQMIDVVEYVGDLGVRDAQVVQRASCGLGIEGIHAGAGDEVKHAVAGHNNLMLNPGHRNGRLAKNTHRHGPADARTVFIRAGDVEGQLRATVTGGSARHNAPGICAIGKTRHVEGQGAGRIVRVVEFATVAVIVAAGNLAICLPNAGIRGVASFNASFRNAYAAVANQRNIVDRINRNIHFLAGRGAGAVGNHNLEIVVEVVVGPKAVYLGVVQHIFVGVGNAVARVTGAQRTIGVVAAAAGGDDKITVLAVVNKLAIGVLFKGNRRAAQQQVHSLGVVGVNVLDGKGIAVCILALVVGILVGAARLQVVVEIGPAIARCARFHNLKAHRGS